MIFDENQEKYYGWYFGSTRKEQEKWELQPGIRPIDPKEFTDAPNGVWYLVDKKVYDEYINERYGS